MPCSGSSSSLPVVAQRHRLEKLKVEHEVLSDGDISKEKKIQTYCLVKLSHSTALTFSGADGVKVPTAASIIHTHGVTLTFALWAEGAAATRTGLCGKVVLV